MLAVNLVAVLKQPSVLCSLLQRQFTTFLTDGHDSPVMRVGITALPAPVRLCCYSCMAAFIPPFIKLCICCGRTRGELPPLPTRRSPLLCKCSL